MTTRTSHGPLHPRASRHAAWMVVVLCAIGLAPGCAEKTTHERITMGWTPKGAQASPWDGPAAIPGLELYVVRSGERRSWGAAREPGASGYLRGKPAFDAARARARSDDPALLAALSMLFLEDDVAGKKPWIAPETSSPAPEEQAIASPPSLAGDLLTYWRDHVQLANMVRCQANLADGTVQCELGTKILRERALAEDPMAVLEKDLAADDIHRVMGGIEKLSELGTPESVARIRGMALNEPNFRLRVAAVEAIEEHPGDEVTATLSRVLLFDGYPEVRRAAAQVLGRQGDPAARKALEKAAAGDGDERVRSSAKHALTRLRTR